MNKSNPNPVPLAEPLEADAAIAAPKGLLTFRISRCGHSLDYFVPTEQRYSSDLLFRARVLVAILLTYVALLLSAGLIFSFFTPLSSEYKALTLVITLVPSLLLMALLTYYRISGNHKVCAVWAVSTVYILVYCGLYVSGGPFLSPAAYVVHIPVLLAFCIAGRYAGFLWAGIVFCTQLLFISLDFYGYQFPYFVDPAAVHLNEVLDWSIAFTATIAIVVVYELMNSKLKNERDEERRRLEFMATHDALTMLPNRVLFQDRLDSAISRARRNNCHFSVIYLDLDGFKPINDKHGHHTGDEVLRLVAQRLKQGLRESDVVARLGGDEFGILVEGINGQEAINVLLATIPSPLSGQFHVMNTPNSGYLR